MPSRYAADIAPGPVDSVIPKCMLHITGSPMVDPSLYTRTCSYRRPIQRLNERLSTRFYWAFDNGMQMVDLLLALSTIQLRNQSLFSPVNQNPSDGNCSYSPNQQSNTGAIAHLILRPKPRLVHLRPNNSHQLCTCIGDSNRESRRRRAMCSSDALWPENWIDADGASDGDADDEILGKGRVQN